MSSIDLQQSTYTCKWQHTTKFLIMYVVPKSHNAPIWTMQQASSVAICIPMFETLMDVRVLWTTSSVVYNLLCWSDMETMLPAGPAHSSDN